MSTDALQPYRIELSDQVRTRIFELADAARDRGDGPAFLAALKGFYHRLRVYPQFGDPLADLVRYVGQTRIGIIPPLSMRYGVIEDERLVFVTALPVLMPKPAAAG